MDFIGGGAHLGDANGCGDQPVWWCLVVWAAGWGFVASLSLLEAASPPFEVAVTSLGMVARS